jgi:hypothetical protein
MEHYISIIGYRQSLFFSDESVKYLVTVSGVFKNGGADGIRTHDLLDAIEARSQLRHGPTEL